MLKENIELEEKFEIRDEISVVVSALAELGFSEAATEQQTDLYWDDSNFTITNLKRGLRERRVAGTLKSFEFKSFFLTSDGRRVIEEINLLNADKTPNNDIVHRILYERLGIIVKTLNSLNKTLENSGLKPRIVVDKTRRIFSERNGNIEIAVDNITGLNPHLEIELKGSDIGNYREIIKRITKKALLAPSNRGYLELLTKENPQILTSEAFDKRFAQNYSWNVLPSEYEIVKELFS